MHMFVCDVKTQVLLYDATELSIKSVLCDCSKGCKVVVAFSEQKNLLSQKFQTLKSLVRVLKRNREINCP